jgi:hypothetical protein
MRAESETEGSSCSRFYKGRNLKGTEGSGRGQETEPLRLAISCCYADKKWSGVYELPILTKIQYGSESR